MTMKDYDRETSSVSVNVGAITSALFDGLVTSTNSLRTAIEGVSIGLTAATQLAERTALAAPNAAASSQLAQREAKWLVRYFDTVTFTAGTFEIPCADLSLLVGNSPILPIDAGPGLALVNAIEDTVLSPAENPVEVVEIVHVGRNN